MEWFENYDLTDIVTPLNVKVYENLLHQANYDKAETDYLVKGFSEGFSFEFEGNR